MADTAFTGSPDMRAPHKTGRLTRLMASPSFQRWAARLPVLRGKVRREGQAMFDLVAGFCHAQILHAVVKLNIPAMLLEEELPPATLAARCAVPTERMQVLINAAVALRLFKIRRNGRVSLTTRGAALAGVPGLQGMIAHHDVLYRDLADPVAFFRGETETELADFWPYVFGAGGATDPAVTATYSDLMSDSQGLVADDTLDTVSLTGVAHLMDVGGGTGAFLAAVARRYPALEMTLFDLPAVVPAAEDRFAQLGCADRVTLAPGSFRDDPLPAGPDMITLIRVLYDHTDDTVTALLRAVHATLPPGGRILISEPMTGGDTPQRPGDAYFALYCMAMRTGRARSAAEITDLLTATGFANVRVHRDKRAYVTTAIEAVRQG